MVFYHDGVNDTVQLLNIIAFLCTIDCDELWLLM